MTIIDSVASEPIINCHQAEEFVSQDVEVWGSKVFGSVIKSALPLHPV